MSMFIYICQTTLNLQKTLNNWNSEKGLFGCLWSCAGGLWPFFGGLSSFAGGLWLFAGSLWSFTGGS